MSTRIGLFANRDSRQLAEIAEAVATAGAMPVMLDLRIGGRSAESDQPALALGCDGSRWGDEDFADIRAIHIRCTTPRTLPTLPPVLNPVSHAEYRLEFLREQAYQAATYAFFEAEAARGKLVVNRLTTAYIDHNSKSQFYEKLRAAGFLVPHSLSTTCPEAAARFLDQVGEAVIKPAIGVGSTRIVTAADRNRLATDLPLCPALFQERVPGHVIRIHVVGDSMVLALRILSEEVDSRTGTKEFEPAVLPEAEAAAIVRANRFLGLHYAAWDAIARPDGRLSYLDCNPGPFLGWLPEASRKYVFACLARYLIGFAETGSLESASAAVAAFVKA